MIKIVTLRLFDDLFAKENISYYHNVHQCTIETISFVFHIKECKVLHELITVALRIALNFEDTARIVNLYNHSLFCIFSQQV